MTFFDPKHLRIGAMYLLTEFVGGKPTSLGRYILVEAREVRQKNYPRLGFARLKDIPPQVFLEEGHTQFGDPTWRHAFKTDRGWDFFWPVGARSWNCAHVEITEITVEVRDTLDLVTLSMLACDQAHALKADLERLGFQVLHVASGSPQPIVEYRGFYFFGWEQIEGRFAIKRL